MVTLPKSPPAYARSSDMYSHMGTMPRPNIKKAQKQQTVQKAQEVSQESHLISRRLPEPPDLEAAKEAEEGTEALQEDMAPSAIEVNPMRKLEDLTVDTKEEQVPGDVHPER